LATTSDNGFVDAKSGEVTARRLGTVTVQATHGTMHATDTIEIVRKPDCTKVTLTYEHSELGVGETGLPMHSFTGPSEDGNDPANCSQPVEAASYSSSNSDVASVVSYSGKITAHALGTAMITVKIGDGPMQGQAELKVVRE
jgi:uncharacterized protein YjdB